MTSVFKLQSNLKLQGEIDADDNARMRFQEVVAPEIEVPLFEGINKQPFHDETGTSPLGSPSSLNHLSIFFMSIIC